MTQQRTNTVLDQIIEGVREDLEARRAVVSLQQLQRTARTQAPSGEWTLPSSILRRLSYAICPRKISPVSQSLPLMRAFAIPASRYVSTVITHSARIAQPYRPCSPGGSTRLRLS